MSISLIISYYAIIRHLCNYSKPYLQRYIIRILFIVPIYSMNAWIAMILPAVGIYLDSLREVYESFVIYSFMKYLFNFLRYDTNLQQYIQCKAGPSHIFPLCCLPGCVGGETFMVRCKHGILQYVVVRPITALVAFVSQLFDFYGEGNYNPFSGYTSPVLLLINNASQVIAMYCLVIFYTGYKQELSPMNPLVKFLSIKLVVFFSFFQSVVISGLMEIDFVEQTARQFFPGIESKVAISRKIQEFLICFDMLIAAIVHLFAFSHKPYLDDDDVEISLVESTSTGSRSRSRASYYLDESKSCCKAFQNLMDFSDEKSDIREHFSQIFSKVRQVFIRHQPLPTIVSSSDNLGNDWMNSHADRLEAVTTSSVQPDPFKADEKSNSPTRNYNSIE